MHKLTINRFRFHSLIVLILVGVNAQALHTRGNLRNHHSVKDYWGAFDESSGRLSTMGGLRTFGENRERAYVSAYVQIPAYGGYSHAGVVLGHRSLSFSQPDRSTAYLAVLHGGEGQFMVSLFDGLTDGHEMVRIPVPSSAGYLELDVDSGELTVIFNGETLIQRSADRSLCGEWGIRGGSNAGAPIVISQVHGG